MEFVVGNDMLLICNSKSNKLGKKFAILRENFVEECIYISRN